MTGTGGWGSPGVGSELSTFETELFWGSDQARSGALWQSGIFSGTIRDDANTPTTHIRPGLLLGKITSTGKLEEWDADVSTGTQNLVGVLDSELRATDFQANNVDRTFRFLVARAPIKASALLIQGAAFVGHADEYLARRQLWSANFILDDDAQGYKAGAGNRMALVSDTTDILTAAENGSTIFYDNVAAVAVTLPTLQPGLSFELVRTANEELVVAAAVAGTVVVGNDLSANGVTFTTAGEQIGATVRVESVYIGATLKWRITFPYVPFGTGLNTMTFSIQT